MYVGLYATSTHTLLAQLLRRQKAALR